MLIELICISNVDQINLEAVWWFKKGSSFFEIRFPSYRDLIACTLPIKFVGGRRAHVGGRKGGAIS